MLVGRVLLKSACSRGAFVQAVCSANERTIQRLHHNFARRCDHVNSLLPPAHPISLKVKTQSCLHQITLRHMEPVGISYGNNTAAASGGEDDEGGGAEEDVEAEKRCLGDDGTAGTTMMTPGQMDMARMEFQDEVAEMEASKMLNEKNAQRKVRRERRKLWKKKLKSTEPSDSLMSELPFALTSPTAWKELGFSNQDSCQKKRKRKRGDSAARVDSEEDADKKKKKKDNQRPNYFVSIPITNKQISSAVTEVQEAVLEREPLLAKAMIPIPTLHITLLVTHLANQEQVDLAATVLARVAPSLAELLGGQDLVLPFSGISHFRKEVVFVGLAPGQHRHTLDSLAELLRCRFEEEGLLQEGRGFEPHLTIMKLSRASKLRSQGIKRVDPSLYSNYTNRFFGDQTVERVDLCSMLKKKKPDGYYHTETSLQLNLVQRSPRAKRSSGRRRTEPDEAELLRISKRLVEDAVNRALQQYKQETLQNGGGPNAAAAAAAAQPPGKPEDATTRTDTTANSTADSRK